MMDRGRTAEPTRMHLAGLQLSSISQPQRYRILDQIILRRRGRAVRCRRSSSVPGPHPLGVRSALLQLVMIKNVPRCCQMSPGGTKLAQMILNYKEHKLIKGLRCYVLKFIPECARCCTSRGLSLVKGVSTSGTLRYSCCGEIQESTDTRLRLKDSAKASLNLSLTTWQSRMFLPDLFPLSFHQGSDLHLSLMALSLLQQPRQFLSYWVPSLMKSLHV